MLRPVLAAAVASLAGVCLAADQAFETGGTLLVTVVDRANRPTVNVDVTDFVLSQGGEPLEVLAVRVADYPLVLLLDDGGSDTEFSAIRSAARQFVERVGDRAVAVLTLGDPPAVISTFEDSRQDTIARIEAARPADTGGRAPLQALAAASRLISETGTRFSAIVLVSAGPIETEGLEPPGVLTAFVESRAILHVVTRGEAGTPAGPRSGPMLRSLASRSGGRLLVIYSAASFPIALGQLADHLGTELLVEYLGAAKAPAGAEVRVGVRLPGARVRGLGVAR